MRVVYLGSGDIGVPSLRWLLDAPHVEVCVVITQPDRPSGRHLEIHDSPIKQLALSSHVPVFQPVKIRDEQAVAHIASLQPDLLVVMAYGQILPREILEIPRLGALNLHASLLPKHRGAAPIQAALLTGDLYTGVTAMWMDEGLDTGDILLQRRFEIAPNETAGSLHDRLAAQAPEILNESLALIKSGQAPRQKQNEKDATYAPKLHRYSGRIDWTLDAAQIVRRVRAFHPWPGSSTELELADGRVMVVKIHKAQAADGAATCGEILEGFLVGCGDGLVRVLEIQAAGGKRMEADAFLRGHHVIRTRLAQC